jgi:predicted SnoaL-like aldol condensation-catalyzing enzyme
MLFMKRYTLFLAFGAVLYLMIQSCSKESCATTVWFQDIDGDGFGNINVTTTGCDRPDKYTGNNSDVDDNNKDVGTQQDMAVAVLRSTQSKKVYAPVTYINPAKFIQHDLHVPDGANAFVQAIQNGQFKGDTLNIQRVFTDSNVVVMHSRLQIDTTKAWIQFDVFRFEDGRIVEHWNNRALEVNDKDSSTQFDGTRRILASVSTSATRTLIQNATDELFIKGNWSKVATYFNLSKFAQHRNGWGRDGAAFRDSVALIPDGTPYYESIKFIHVKGDFALVMSQGYPNPVSGNGLPVAHYDLFRVSENKIVEQWEVVEEIPPMNLWSNPNGKW